MTIGFVTITPGLRPASPAPQTTGSHERSGNALLLIGLFKLVKGILLVAVGIGAFRLLHKDVADAVEGWVQALRVDPDNHYVHMLLGKLTSIDDRRLREIGIGTFLYAAILLIEGTGLVLRKRWAEYFTIVATGFFIPLEIYELQHKPSVTKALVLIVNAAIVWYLVVRVRKTGRSEKNSV